MWERSFAGYCDRNNNIVQWSVEPFTIPYFDVGQRKYRKYWPDFWIKKSDGTILLIEIKPEYQTKPPQKPKRKTKKALLAEQTWLTNKSKWQAAREFCDQKGWKFQILTEKTLRNIGIKIL